jgi:Collagen triple helix repeat (20 copies)
MPRLREQFSTTALILSVIALVFALMGGAYAASHAQNKKSVAKRGPRGPKGPAGSAGPAGPAGPAGAKGDAGAAGQNGEKGERGLQGEHGTQGVKGDDGEIPLMQTFTGERTVGSVVCAEGGVEFELNGEEVAVCNGKQGVDGEKGEPWTDGGTLPSGATETGTWAFNGTEENKSPFRTRVPISFPIPLPFELPNERAHIGEAGEGGAFEEGSACPGSSFREPKAAPGQLCVYVAQLFGAEFKTILKVAGSSGVAAFGAVLQFESTSPGPSPEPPAEPEPLSLGVGSFAVTGCTEKVVGGVGQEECE